MNFYTDDISTYLKENGIRPSYQRLKIFEFIMKNHIHPTIDVIYKALCREIPTLSKTTVYNTLNLFVEKKIANVIVIEENETRYDIMMSTHGHFKCNKCGKLFDIELKEDFRNLEELKSCQIEEKHFYFKGVCKDCVNK